MAQSELCVVECDSCGKFFHAEDWAEAHEIGADTGWSMTATEDLCRECA